MANSRKQEWKEKVWQPATERSGERQARFETSSEIEVEPIYTPEDVSNQDYDRDLGFPGSFPYTRGVQPTMYRGRIWTMRQYSGFASAEETNRRYHYLLEQGQTGLSMAFDLPTQTGYDSDHPIAYSEVGRVGVPISHLEDMETVFEGINLAEVSTSMTINATASLLLAYYIAMAKKQGVDPKELRGTVQNDIPEGVHSQRHPHLSGGSFNEAGDRPLCLLRLGNAQLEHHLHQRLSHAGGGLHGCTGGRLYPGERYGVRPGRRERRP